jgi:hypothetical protein
LEDDRDLTVRERAGGVDVDVVAAVVVVAATVVVVATSSGVQMNPSDSKSQSYAPSAIGVGSEPD